MAWQASGCCFCYFVASLVTHASHFVHLVAGSVDENSDTQYTNVDQYWCWVPWSPLLPAHIGPLAFLPFLLCTLNNTHSCVHFYGHCYLFPGYLLLLSTFQIGFICKYILPLQVETQFLGIVVRLCSSSSVLCSLAQAFNMEAA